jgi:Predicted branched-chain amino acid permease (azaleucine resistance)
LRAAPSSPLPLIAAGAPLWLILGTAFCVNLRFVVFSAQMRPYFEQVPRWRRLAYGYLIGDLNQVLMIRRHPHPTHDPQQTQYFLGVSLTNWVAWQIPSLLGIAMAQHIPGSWGLAFAGTLALLGIVLSLLADRTIAGVIIVASALSALLFWLPLRLNLVAAIVGALIVGMAWEAWSSRQLTAALCSTAPNLENRAAMTLFQQIALVVGMTAVTVLSRNLFLLSRKAMPLPARVKIALRFAPAAALAAVLRPSCFYSPRSGRPG